MNFRTMTIKDRGKIVSALTRGKITANEALDLIIEADIRDSIMKGAKSETQRPSKTGKHSN